MFPFEDTAIEFGIWERLGLILLFLDSFCHLTTQLLQPINNNRTIKNSKLDSVHE